MTEDLGEVLEVGGVVVVYRYAVGDAFARVQDGGVVAAAECLPDAAEGRVSEFA